MKVIANLSGLFLCPFQSLLDITEQFTNTDITINQLAFSPLCELNTTNDWINLEALGNPVALRAEEMCRALTKTLTQQAIQRLELHINLVDAELTIDNVFALLFLAESLTALELIFYVKPQKILRLQQALLAFDTKTNVSISIHHDELFTSCSTSVKTSQQLEAARTRLLQANGYHFNTTLFRGREITVKTAGPLFGYAWACLKAGAYELGCHALDYALSKATLGAAIHEQLFMHLQVVRFLSHQYEAVTNEPFPEHFESLEKHESINLYFIKAYAATLSRNLPVAERYFHKSAVHRDMPMTDETSLFRLNLHALYLVLSGEIDSALTLELDIKSFIEKNRIDNLGLKYVNFINIARVYKKLGQFNTSLTYYEKAYHELKGGGFTTSDRIYYNMNFGSLFEAAGQPEKAIFFWINAAIHWLTCTNQYALAWRPRLILCQEKITDIVLPLSSDKVHQFLFDKISALITQSGIALKNQSTQPVHFIADDKANLAETAGYLVNNILLYCKTGKAHSPAASMTASEQNLHQLLSGLTRTLLKPGDDELTLIIDGRHEIFYPQSEEECLLLSVLSGCTVFYYEGRRINFHANDVLHYLSQSKMTLSKTIHSVESVAEGLQLKYNRSFLNKTVRSTDDIHLIEQFSHKKTVEFQQLPSHSSESLKRLLTKKVITLTAEA